MRTYSVAIALAALTTISGLNHASGQTITPVRAIASTYYSGQQNPNNLIDGYGFDSTVDISLARQSPDGNGNLMWHAGGGQGNSTGPSPVANQFLIFDLGGTYDLSSADLWQFAQIDNINRGVRSFTVLTSSAAPNETTWGTPASYNLSGFTPVLSNAQLNVATNNTSVGRQAFSLTGTTGVRQVVIRTNSAWSGSANDYVGLSEVRFRGSLAAGAPTATYANGNFSGSLTSDTDLNLNNNVTQTVSVTSATAARSLNVSAGNHTVQATGTGSFAFQEVNVTNGGKAQLNNFIAGRVYNASDATTLYSPVPRYNGSTGANVVNVSGAGSELTFNANALTATDANRTTFGVNRQVAQINVTDGGLMTFNDGVRFGYQNGTANVVVDGANSRMQVNNPAGTTNAMFVGSGTASAASANGYSGTGFLTVTNGGAVNANSEIRIGGTIPGSVTNGRGIVRVGKTDGSDSAVSTLSAANISVNAGGQLYVNAKGSVTAGFSLNTYSGSSFAVSGGSLKAVLVQGSGSFSWTGGNIELSGAADNSYSTFSSTYNFIVPTAGTLTGSAANLNHGVTVNGTIAPGNATNPIGTARAHSYDLTGTSTTDIDINFGANLTDVLLAERTNGFGVTVADTAKLRINVLDTVTDSALTKTFILVRNDTAGPVAIGGNGFDVLIDDTRWLYTLNYNFTGIDATGRVGNGNDIAITLTSAVPEPGAIGLFLATTTLLTTRRHRRAAR